MRPCQITLTTCSTNCPSFIASCVFLSCVSPSQSVLVVARPSLHGASVVVYVDARRRVVTRRWTARQDDSRCNQHDHHHHHHCRLVEDRRAAPCPLTIPVDNNVDKGFQRRHELDPPRYVEADLGKDSSSDKVFCLPSCQSPVVKHWGPQHPTVQCGQKRTGVAYSDSSNHR